MDPCGDAQRHGVSKELEKENSRFKGLVAQHRVVLAAPAAELGRSRMNRKTRSLR